MFLTDWYHYYLAWSGDPVAAYWLFSIPMAGLFLLIFRLSEWYEGAKHDTSIDIPVVVWSFGLALACGAAWPLTLSYYLFKAVYAVFFGPIILGSRLIQWAKEVVEKKIDDNARLKKAEAKASQIRCYKCTTPCDPADMFCRFCGSDQTLLAGGENACGDTQGTPSCASKRSKRTKVG